MKKINFQKLRLKEDCYFIKDEKLANSFYVYSHKLKLHKESIVSVFSYYEELKRNSKNETCLRENQTLIKVKEYSETYLGKRGDRYFNIPKHLVTSYSLRQAILESISLDWEMHYGNGLGFFIINGLGFSTFEGWGLILFLIIDFVYLMGWIFLIKLNLKW